MALNLNQLKPINLKVKNVNLNQLKPNIKKYIYGLFKIIKLINLICYKYNQTPPKLILYKTPQTNKLRLKFKNNGFCFYFLNVWDFILNKNNLNNKTYNFFNNLIFYKQYLF
jgi:hypothetical protein